MIEFFFVLITSLCIASFINVVSIRVPEEQSIAYPPSHCPSCQHRLAWYDLIPIMSFLMVRGRCRYCGQAISWYYPLGELFTTAVLVVTYFQFKSEPNLIEALVFAVILCAVTLTDFRTMLIPDVILIAGVLLLLPILLWQRPEQWVDMISGSMLGGGVIAVFVFGSLWLLKKEGMGLGDLKFMLFAGAILGVADTVLTLILASFLGGLVGMILIVTRLATRESYIPFGPFLALAAWVSYGWGDLILDWYLNGLWK